MKARLATLFCIIILFLAAPHSSSGVKNLILSLKDSQSFETIRRNYPIRKIRLLPNTQTFLVGVDDRDTRTILTRLRNDASVAGAEEDTGFSLNSTTAPADLTSLVDAQTMTTFYGTHVLRAYADQPALDLIRASSVRGISTGAAIKVAYIDTGVDPFHPALQPWLDPGVDLVANRTSSEWDGLTQSMASLLDQSMASLLDPRFFFILDQSMASLLNGGGSTAAPLAFGHWTMVAGVIHAVAPEARLIPIKAFDVYGSTTTFTVIQAVNQAVALGADVINMSFSTTQSSDALKHAIDAAKNRGISVVASAGNDARDAVGYYPAAYGNIWGVAATDQNDRLASFSNYGGHIAMTAPGTFIISTAPGGRYAAAWGTSFSAPMVTGAIAVVKSVRPGEKDGQSVVTTADHIDQLNPGFGGKLGHGRINLQSALNVH